MAKKTLTGPGLEPGLEPETSGLQQLVVIIE